MIYTFYSYKGGVGRSMALANVAELFYQEGKTVLMVDWDLEAPGLERYFPHLDLEAVLDHPGVIDMLLSYKQQMEQKLPIAVADDLPFAKPGEFTVEIERNESNGGQLLLLPAGRRRDLYFARYAQAVHDFDWDDFYRNWEGELYFNWLREQFEQMADVTLIDSRTGVTEMSGVCTQHLADTVVMFCTPNQQSLSGTLAMAQNLKREKLQALRGGRPVELLVVPARVEDRAEIERLNQFEQEFVSTFDLYLPHTLHDELASFWDLKIPHVPYYAFEETVAVREREGPASKSQAGAEDMIDAFERLLEAMAMLDPKLLPEEEAVDVYLSNRTWDKAASLLDENYEFLNQLYRSGQAKKLDSWLSKFPFRELEQHPQLLLWWGQVLNDDFGQPKRAMTFFNLAKEQFQKQGDAIGVAKAQIWESVGLRMMGQAKKAIELVSEGLEQLRARAADSRLLLAWAVRNRGLAYGTAGDIVQAIADTRRALEDFKLSDHKFMVGLCHHDIGVSLEKQGDTAEAEEHYRQAVEIWKELGNENNLANSLTGLGQTLCSAGRYEAALEVLNEGLEIALRINAIRRAAFAQAGIGDAYFGLRDYEEAVKAYQLSIGYAQDAQVQSLEVANQIKLSECFYAMAREDNLDEALDKATRARQIAIDNGLSYEQALACLSEAKIHLRLEQYAQSIQLLNDAVSYFAEYNRLEHLKAKLLLAYALYLDRQDEAALAQLQEVTTHLLGLTAGELDRDLGRTVEEVRTMLDYFANRADTSTEMSRGVSRLLQVQ